MAALHLRTVFDKLKEQGWAVDQTTQGHWRAVPPDKTKPIVHLARSGDPKALRNAVAQLKRSGLIWEDPPRSTRLPMVPILQETMEVSLLAPEEEDIPIPSDSSPVQDFPSALRRLRTYECLTQEALADLLDVTQSAVCQWEDGTNAPIKDHYEKLLALLPELMFASTPDSKDISKPGQTGLGTVIESAFFGPAPTQETSMNHVQPVQLPLPPPAPNNKAVIVRFVKLVSAVQESADRNCLHALLESAKAEGMTLEDVLEMLA